MLVFLAIAAVIALFVTLAVFAYKKEKARVASLQQLCLSSNWQFSAPDPYGVAQRWPGTPFNAGYDRTARNVITGLAHGHHMIAFDYSYKEDSTDSKGNRTTSTYSFAIVALAMPCALPELHLAPEGVFSRIGHAMGMQDIELESEAFNRRYRVRCPDAKLATDVLTPRTMEMLLAAPKLHFRFVGSDVVSFQSGHLQPADVLARSGALAALVEGVPSFVWKDYGSAQVTPQPAPETLR